MCGRFTREFTWRQVHEFLDLRFPAAGDMITADPGVSYNVAPSQLSPVCLWRDGGRELTSLRWGFQPAWAARAGETKGPPPPINARAETVAASPLFRSAFRLRRCVVPVSGFYEWKPTPGHKQPYYIHLLNDPIIALAGLWEEPARPGPGSGAGAAAVAGTAPGTFATLTTRPNALMATVHDRMPVILRRESIAAWLAPGEVDPSLLEPFPPEEMQAYTVSSRVNKPSVNDPSLIARADPGGLWA